MGRERTNDGCVAPHGCDGSNDKHEDVGSSGRLGRQSQGRHDDKEGIWLQAVHHPRDEGEPAGALPLRYCRAGAWPCCCHLRCRP